jgi:hypothetical protein
MMNSKTYLNHERNDIMTISHFVPTESNLEQLEHYKPIFEHCNTYDPLIAAYDFQWNILFTKPLSQIEGMAYGVREDFLNGKFMLGGWTGNQCPDPASSAVCFWSLVE